MTRILYIRKKILGLINNDFFNRYSGYASSMFLKGYCTLDYNTDLLKTKF